MRERGLSLSSAFVVASPAPPEGGAVTGRVSVRTYLGGCAFQEFLPEAFHVLLSVISPGHKIFPRPPAPSVFDLVQYRFPSELEKGKGSVGF